MAEPTLYDFAPSPFCLKVRALLDYKGVAYRRKSILQPAVWLELRRRSPTRQVPALDIEGELVIDSTAIAHRLERDYPTPAILPSDPQQAALAHLLEDLADESLYFYGLYYRWADPAGIADAGRAFEGPTGPAISWFLRRQSRGRLDAQGIGRRPPSMVADELQRTLRHLAALLADKPFLLGDAPLVCDFSVASQLVYLQRTPTGAPLVNGHPTLLEYCERFRALRQRT